MVDASSVKRKHQVVKSKEQHIYVTYYIVSDGMQVKPLQQQVIQTP
jgi:hypothetical protein